MSGIYGILACVILLIFLIVANFANSKEQNGTANIRDNAVYILKIALIWVAIISAIFFVLYLCGIFTFA